MNRTAVTAALLLTLAVIASTFTLAANEPTTHELDDGSVVTFTEGDITNVVQAHEREVQTEPVDGRLVVADGSILEFDAAGQIVGFTSAEESGLAAVMVWGDYLCTDHSWGHTCFEQMPPGSCGVYYSLTQHSGPGSASSHLIEPCEDE